MAQGDSSFSSFHLLLLSLSLQIIPAWTLDAVAHSGDSTVTEGSNCAQLQYSSHYYVCTFCSRQISQHAIVS